MLASLLFSSAALGAVSVIATSVDLTSYGTHHAPASSEINNLGAVINGTRAPGIFNSSYTPDSVYGVYNWCNMPHVRAREYPMPNSSYELQYLEVIHRHHKRTPYASNTFFREDVTFDCSPSLGARHYARNATGNGARAVPIAWEAALPGTGSGNPFENVVGPGFNSTCQFPQITAGGLEDSWQHGVDLANVYRDKLGFMPSTLNDTEVTFRVTNNEITSQVLGALVVGLFPNVTEHTAIVESASYDGLEPKYTCALADQLRANYTGSDANWTQHLNASAGLYKQLDSISGISNPDTGGWHTSWDHYYDNLSAKQCHGKTLPCNLNDTSSCVSQDMANEVYRLGQYEYSYYYRDALNSTAYSVLKYGVFFKQLRTHIDARLAGGPMKYRHNVAHDGSIAPLLGLLQLDKMVWPGMGSEVVFEVWARDGTDYIRTLWGGQPLVSSAPELGTIDMIPLATFYQYLDTYIPSDLVGQCALTA